MGSRLKMVVLCNLAVVVRCALMIWLLYTTRARWTSDISERQGPSHKLGSHHFVHRERLTSDHSVLNSRQTFWNVQQLSKHNKRKDQVTFLVTNPRLEIGDNFIQPRVWVMTFYPNHFTQTLDNWNIRRLEKNLHSHAWCYFLKHWMFGVCEWCIKSEVAQIMLWSTILQILEESEGEYIWFIYIYI